MEWKFAESVPGKTSINIPTGASELYIAVVDGDGSRGTLIVPVISLKTNGLSYVLYDNHANGEYNCIVSISKTIAVLKSYITNNNDASSYVTVELYYR